MHTSEVFSRLKKVLLIEFGLEEDEIKLELSFVADLNADHFVLVEFMLELEYEFGITLQVEEMEQLATVADALALLEERVSQQH